MQVKKKTAVPSFLYWPNSLRFNATLILTMPEISSARAKAVFPAPLYTRLNTVIGYLSQRRRELAQWLTCSLGGDWHAGSIPLGMPLVWVQWAKSRSRQSQRNGLSWICSGKNKSTFRYGQVNFRTVVRTKCGLLAWKNLGKNDPVSKRKNTSSRTQFIHHQT